MQGGIEGHVAAAHGGALDAGEVQGAALAGEATLGRVVLRVEGAHARRETGGAQRHAVTDRDGARQHRAGDDRPGPGQHEGAVDREAETARAVARRQGGAFGLQRRLQGLHVLARHRRDRQDGGVGEGSAGEGRADLGLDGGAAPGVGEIGLGQDHEAAAEPEQVRDGEVFARLGHDAVVGRHDQHQEVDAGRARHHGADEAFVARHVDEAQGVAVARRQIGEAEVDGDAALLLLGQPIGVGARKGPHQRGLAVVDVPGRADDQALPPGSGAAARRSASAMPAASTAPRAVGR